LSFFFLFQGLLDKNCEAEATGKNSFHPKKKNLKKKKKKNLEGGES
jgi:hypothetical protein